MNDKPRVTYIIANHNYGEYVTEAIQSALNQDYDGPLKICVIDDGSTDDSLEKIKKFGDKIEIISIPTATGPSNARNLGIRHTWNNTDVYAILDADDINYPTKISKCVELMLLDFKRIGVVYADYDILNTVNGNITYEYKKSFDRIVLARECIVHSGALINKGALAATIENTGFYDETMRTCEDFDLWQRIADKFMILHIAEPLSLVRITPKNSTDTVSKEIWNKNWQRVQQKMIQRHNAV